MHTQNVSRNPPGSLFLNLLPEDRLILSRSIIFNNGLNSLKYNTTNVEIRVTIKFFPLNSATPFNFK